jgi:dTDP-4-amino-4,6-dideoxygalactose transaminase
LAELCRSATNCGRRSGGAWYDHDYLGSNLRLTEFQAAVLIAQLGRLDQQIDTREKRAALLDRRLAELPGMRTATLHPRMTRRSYHLYIFRIDESELGISRDRFVEALCAEGVPASRGWYHPLYANGVFRKASSDQAEHAITSPLSGKGLDYTRAHCPVAEQVCRDAVWLPQNVLLAPQEDIAAIADAIEKVVANAKDLR